MNSADRNSWAFPWNWFHMFGITASACSILSVPSKSKSWDNLGKHWAEEVISLYISEEGTYSL